MIFQNVAATLVRQIKSLTGTVQGADTLGVKSLHPARPGIDQFCERIFVMALGVIGLARRLLQNFEVGELRELLPKLHVVVALFPDDARQAPFFAVMSPGGFVGLLSETNHAREVVCDAPGIIHDHRGLLIMPAHLAV